MAADRALPEDDQAARQDVRAFDRDRDRHQVVAARQVVAGAEHDALAAVDIHRVVGDAAAVLGEVILQHRRRHRRFLAAVDRAGRDGARCVHDVSGAGHARECFRDTFELTDRDVELTADARVRAGREHCCFRRARRARRQRNAAADRELLDEHAPALAGHLDAADQEIERHEHVLALDRSVLERRVQREVPPADSDAGRVARDQRAGDAEIRALVAEQPIGIEQLEGEADHGRDRCERDVALREVQTHADDLAALVHSLAHDAGVGDRCGVGAGARSGEREARHLFAAREPRQVVSALFFRAVVKQQLAGAERVRHRDGRCDDAGAAGEFHEHARVRVRGELQAAVLLRDDHREEALRLDVVPQVRRQVGAAVRDVPVVDHPAQLFARPVDECLLLSGQTRRRGRQQLVPVGAAGEQLAVPPDRSRFERILLGLRHRRQHASIRAQERTRDEADAERVDVEQHQHREHSDQQQRRNGRGSGESVDQQRAAVGERGGEEADALVSKHQRAEQENKEPDEAGHAQTLAREIDRSKRRSHRDCPTIRR